ncbi:MAG: hypothetical protein V3U54_11035 [Thermodesulfobacteriota bacterium]
MTQLDIHVVYGVIEDYPKTLLEFWGRFSLEEVVQEATGQGSVYE